jgi:hypothetical protein
LIFQIALKTGINQVYLKANFIDLRDFSKNKHSLLFAPSDDKVIRMSDS